jgi:hypothetical protein
MFDEWGKNKPDIEPCICFALMGWGRAGIKICWTSSYDQLRSATTVQKEKLQS